MKWKEWKKPVLINDISVLFARKDSIYKELCSDVWDINRDARNYIGLNPVVAHPPCRGWGRLKGFAKPRPDEKDLARFAVKVVRKFGGVLEHPEWSSLWKDQALPLSTERDDYGGFTLHIDQCWFGHKARKATFLYIVGCSRRSLPKIELSLDDVEYTIAGGRKHKPGLSKHLREATPPLFANFLLEIASHCRK